MNYAAYLIKQAVITAPQQAAIKSYLSSRAGKSKLDQGGVRLGIDVDPEEEKKLEHGIARGLSRLSVKRDVLPGALAGAGAGAGAGGILSRLKPGVGKMLPLMLGGAFIGSGLGISGAEMHQGWKRRKIRLKLLEMMEKERLARGGKPMRINLQLRRKQGG